MMMMIMMMMMMSQGRMRHFRSSGDTYFESEQRKTNLYTAKEYFTLYYARHIPPCTLYGSRLSPYGCFAIVASTGASLGRSYFLAI